MSKAVSINYPSRNAMQAEVEFFRLAPVLCAGVNGAPRPAVGLSSPASAESTGWLCSTPRR
jgi:hypothetical protein